MYTSYSGMLYLLRNKMAARVKLILLFLLQVYSITGVTSLCPLPDYSFDGSCGGATQTITVDWSTYPTATCQEVEIVIPADYVADTCTWQVEHSGSTVTTGIAVNAVTDGVANGADTISVAFVENSVTQTASYSGFLDDLYTSPEHGTVSNSGPSEAVIITFNSGGGGASLSGFTFRVVIYAMDEADVCGSASSPKTISLTTDYPVASLATPNFPSNYPEGAVCYTNIDSPDGYNVMVNYIAADIVNLADYFFIYNLINPSSPILLRAETTGFLSASQLRSRSFDTRTSALHTVFSDTGTTENPGILVVFSAVPDVQTSICGACDCTAFAASAGDMCEDPSGRFVARAATPDDTACPAGATFDLMYTEAESHFYIATQNFNSGGYTSATGSCNIVITGPLNSEIIIIFRTFDLSPGGNLILTGGLGIDRIGRIGGTEPTFPYSDGSTMRNFGIVDREILITANRLVINFRNDDAGSGQGVAFEVRLVDNRCGMCLNGGFCDSCSCASGYYGNRCQNTIVITVTSTTSQTRDEGESIEIMCSSNRGFTDQTEVVFALDPASTAVEGLDIPFLAGYPCTFLANRATASVTIPTIDDDFMEGQEDLILVVSEVTGGGHPSAADSSPPLVFSINADSDSFLVPIEFANSLYDVSEGAGSVTVTIEFKFLNQPLPIPEDGSISFTYTPGSATSGNDFTEVTTVNFVKSTSPVTTSVELVIPIIDDDTVESTETFEVQMTISSTVLTLGTTSAITIRILDNDVIDNVVIVDYPNIKKASATEVHLFAFSNQNQAVVFEKLNSAAPETTDNPLVLCGSSFGRTASLPLPTRSPARRLGRYRVTFDGDSNNAIYAFVSPDSGCLNSDETTITVYPESFGSTFLDSVLVFGLQTVASCTTQIKWQRIGGPISNTGRTHRISRTEDADGTYIITRRNRASSGWFEIIDVILSRCPRGFYGGGCSQSKQCQNGGILEADGTCSCPPCFSGEFCELKYTTADSFGKGQRFTCSELHPGLATRTNCQGLQFCYGGLYGCSCGCGWSGRDCNTACNAGFYGADCKQRCSCHDSLCDRFTGCP